MASLGIHPLEAARTKYPARWAMTTPTSIRKVAPDVAISSFDKDLLKIFTKFFK